jgi:group I intron endonuclease
MKNNKKNIVLARIYSNVETQKKEILKENKNKAGIYLFINLTNNYQYVGSSVNLKIRFYRYFNVNYLKNNICMRINRALLKYGNSKFSLIILEYCSSEKCILRERHYIDLLEPEYNIIQDPTLPPMLGRKHSDETLQKMSDAQKKNEGGGHRFKKGENNPNYGQNHSEETRKKLSDAMTGEKKSYVWKNSF